MDKQLKPQHLNAWRLFITAHARVVSDIESRLAVDGQIPLHWYDVLIELFEAPDRRLRMNELAERVLLTRSGLTRLVDRLEKQGYLRRELDPNDRRGFFAIISDSGIEAMRHAWPVYARGIAEQFAAHVSDEEAEVLARVFARIAQSE